MGECVSWRYINASVVGTSHFAADTPCQDDCIVDVLPVHGDELLVAVLADGAGSAPESHHGASLACSEFVAAITRWSSSVSDVEDLDEQTIFEWIERVRMSIENRATEFALTSRDFACTFLAAIVSKHTSIFVQIGDGAIVVRANGELDAVFWPDSGEYANMTYFVTDPEWREHVHFSRGEAVHDLALTTDGLQKLALHFATRSVHSPFFDSMFAALQRTPPGYAEQFQEDLIAFLQSDAVNGRTDDDKSLVLATRAAKEGASPDDAVL
jgi:hypothetical protein